MEKIEKTEKMFQKINKFGILDKRFELEDKIYDMRVKGFVGYIFWYLHVIIILILILNIDYILSLRIKNIFFDLFLITFIILAISLSKVLNNKVRHWFFFKTDYIEIKLVGCNKWEEKV